MSFAMLNSIYKWWPTYIPQQTAGTVTYRAELSYSYSSIWPFNLNTFPVPANVHKGNQIIDWSMSKAVACAPVTTTDVINFNGNSIVLLNTSVLLFYKKIQKGESLEHVKSV